MTLTAPPPPRDIELRLPRVDLLRAFSDAASAPLPRATTPAPPIAPAPPRPAPLRIVTAPAHVQPPLPAPGRGALPQAHMPISIPPVDLPVQPTEAEPASSVAGDVVRTLAIVAVLKLALVATEAFGAHAGSSLAMLADSVHMLGDIVGVLVALAAAVVGRTDRARGWAWSRMAARCNGVLLAIVAFGLAREAVGALGELGAHAAEHAGHAHEGGGHAEHDAHSSPLLVGVRVAGSLLALYLLRPHRAKLEVHAVAIHARADLLIGCAVLLGALVHLAVGVEWLDPVLALGIAALIAHAAWQLLFSRHPDGMPESTT